MKSYIEEIERIILARVPPVNGKPNLAYLNGMHHTSEKLWAAAVAMFHQHPEDRDEHDDWLIREGLHELERVGYLGDPFYMRMEEN